MPLDPLEPCAFGAHIIGKRVLFFHGSAPAGRNKLTLRPLGHKFPYHGNYKNIEKVLFAIITDFKTVVFIFGMKFTERDTNH